MKRFCVIVGILLCISPPVHSQAHTQVGYAVLSSDAGARLPVGTALFSYTNSNGVLVSEAAVGASAPIRSGRIFVDETSTQTGVALANSSASAAAITLTLRDSAGHEISRQPLTIGPREQVARYVSQLFPTRPSNFTGSLSFESDQPLAAITLRESRNAFEEPLYTTLPVQDLSASSSTPPIFPHIAAGAGYTTQIILINPTATTVRGQVRLFASDGTPLQLQLSGRTVSQFEYQIEGNGTFSASLDAASGLNIGYAQVVPDVNNAAPGGSAIFQFRRNGLLVTEAGVAAGATTVARIFVDQIGTQTGIAIANPSLQEAPLTLTLTDRTGAVEATLTRTLPPQGHMAMFANELFAAAGEGFTGVLEVRSSTPVASIALKLTNNTRGEFVLTTLPIADLTSATSTASSVFAHLAIGGGFSTRLLFINVDGANTTSGRVAFFQSDGAVLNLPLEGNTSNQFNYRLFAGGGRQLLPGNLNPISSLFLLTSANQPTTEIAVNEGNTVRARIRALDTTGRIRDDFDAAYASLDAQIATTDASGNVSGIKAGFSTFTISARGVISSATISVVSINSANAGFEITGIAQDLAKRVYLAATADQTVRVAADLNQPTTIYAGVSQRAGFKNDVRAQSEFRDPAFLTIAQGDGSLFVVDASNHAIRRVQPGTNGRVQTVAGTGTAGSEDGPAQTARFNNPQGIALDARGNLWIADSGNHSIRRMNLVLGTVETIAGKSGEEGFADGAGPQARFRSPVGIAMEPEPIAQQLDRERRGAPPPPVSVIVADSGNGVLRRVSESGEVTTLSAGAAAITVSSSSTGTSKPPINLAALVGTPSGVGVDPFGNIYVTDSTSGQVRALLRNGALVDAVQPNTFQGPKGIAITEGGRILVADGSRTAKQIQFGGPRVISLDPLRVSTRGGARVIIKGANFSPDTIVVIGGVLLGYVRPLDTQTIAFIVPELPSGRSTVTVQNRGGIAQASLLIDAIPLEGLPVANITTVAGGTTFAGDGRSAIAAMLGEPYGIAFDTAGNLFIADTNNHRVRRIDAATGIITTIAGTGTPGERGDNGPATAAELIFPQGVAVDSSGNVYIATGQRIRKVDAATGLIATLSSTFVSPFGLTIDANNNLYVSDFYDHRVRKLSLVTGSVITFAGTGQEGFAGDGGQAAAAALTNPAGLTVDRAGNLFVADAGDRRVRRVDAVTGVISTVAGNGALDDGGNGGPALAASFVYPGAVAVDANDNLLILDGYGELRRVNATTGIISLIAGTGDFTFSGDGGPAVEAAFGLPQGLALDGAGNIFIADTFNNRVRRISTLSGIINTVAGSTDTLSNGDNGSATVATLNLPRGIALNSAGDLYIADGFNHRIRKVDATTGIITTVAGTGTAGFAGDGGPAQKARLFFPEAVAVASGGDLYFSDSSNDRIRRVSAQTGAISTVAGNGDRGFSGDGLLATSVSLNRPRGVVVDRAGNLFIADTGNNRIRKVDAATGVITTIAGIGAQSYSGDGGRATTAALNAPEGIALDAAGNVFFTDTGNNVVRKIAVTTGIITTVAGTGELDGPDGITIDAAGNLYISDSNHAVVRKVDAATGIMKTIAGSGTAGFAGDGGAAIKALLYGQNGLAISPRGDLFISDFANSRIRAVRGPIQ